MARRITRKREGCFRRISNFTKYNRLHDPATRRRTFEPSLEIGLPDTFLRSMQSFFRPIANWEQRRTGSIKIGGRLEGILERSLHDKLRNCTDIHGRE
jgi:hypothetical protein